MKDCIHFGYITRYEERTDIIATGASAVLFDCAKNLVNCNEDCPQYERK